MWGYGQALPASREIVESRGEIPKNAICTRRGWEVPRFLQLEASCRNESYSEKGGGSPMRMRCTPGIMRTMRDMVYRTLAAGKGLQRQPDQNCLSGKP